MEEYKIISSNKKLYELMLNDILKAKKYVYLETYIFGNDEIGKKFRDALIEKSQNGIVVKLLIDDWGSNVGESFFKELIDNGGEIKLFRKFRFSIKLIHKNNHRNHRKLLLIDDEISYIGSSNIAKKCLEWRELNVRINNKMTCLFKKAYLQNFSIANTHIFKRSDHLETYNYEDIEIFREVPSIKFKKIRNKQIELIKKAKKTVYIETPYFLPDKKLRKEFKRAIKRGVDIKLVIPVRSDVLISDIARERYLGILHNQGMDIRLYETGVLHSKLMLIDNKAFSTGSANLNYRSLFLEFEINIFGENEQIIKGLEKHAQETLKNCEKFNFKKWKNRSLFRRILGKILEKVKKML